jgi:hypothetical protein
MQHINIKFFSFFNSISMVFGAISCNSRSFNTVDPSSQPKSTKVARVSLSPPNYTNDMFIQRDKIHDSRNLYVPDGKLYSTLLNSNGLPTGWGESPADIPDGLSLTGNKLLVGSWSVLDYEKRIEKAGRVQTPLQSEDVLKILRRNRDEFSTVVANGVTSNPTALGYLSKYPTAFKALTVNGMKPFSDTYCKGFEVSNYSDLKWHYYCQIPAIFRGCHRLLIGKYLESEMNFEAPEKKITEAKLLAKIQKVAEKDHELVMEYCNNEGKISDPDYASYQNIFDSEISNMEIFYKYPRGTFAKGFKDFYLSQYLDIQDTKSLNLFDYIMKSEVYAFPYEQQNTVLNTFYGDFAADGKFDKKKCADLREPRLGFEDPKAGTHCNAKTPKLAALFSFGR